MPNNLYTTGRDIKLVLVTSRGILDPQEITEFNARETPTNTKVEPIDGTTDNLRFSSGWEGDFSIARRNAVLDQYVSDREAGYFNGDDEPASQILETITEVGGGISQYRYEGVVLGAFDTGTVKGKDTRNQKLPWMASRRIKLV